jgi:hypothetical protein
LLGHHSKCNACLMRARRERNTQRLIRGGRLPCTVVQVQRGAHELRYGRVSGKQVSFCAFHPGFHAEGPLSFTREQVRVNPPNRAEEGC